METMVKLRASGGEIIEVEEAVAQESGLIRRALEYKLGAEVIPIANISAPVLNNIMAYCRKHTLDKPRKKEDLDEWVVQFLDIDPLRLGDLAVSANFLEVDGLRDKILDKVAEMIMGKSPEDIRALLHIENDFSPEEEKAIRDKCPWAFQYNKVEVPQGDGASSSSRGGASSSST